jgi:hypothetical protein
LGTFTLSTSTLNSSALIPGALAGISDGANDSVSVVSHWGQRIRLRPALICTEDVLAVRPPAVARVAVPPRLSVLLAVLDLPRIVSKRADKQWNQQRCHATKNVHLPSLAAGGLEEGWAPIRALQAQRHVVSGSGGPV